MTRRLAVLLHPMGMAFGAFILLNVFLSLQNPRLSITGAWLDARLPEPWLSLFAGILGLSLIVPHSFAGVSWIRWLTAGVFAGFGILTLASTLSFYHSLYHGRIATGLPNVASLIADVYGCRSKWPDLSAGVQSPDVAVTWQFAV